MVLSMVALHPLFRALFRNPVHLLNVVLQDVDNDWNYKNKPYCSSARALTYADDPSLEEDR